MKSLFAFIFCAIITASCATSGKIIPIKGEYPSLPIQIVSEKSFDTVWSNLIDLFAQKNLPIKIIDRSSGLIISERTLLKTTIEDKKGQLLNPDAWIVVAKEHFTGINRDLPITGTPSGVYSKNMVVNEVTADWNVRIKTQGNKTIINVNIGIVKFEGLNVSKNFLVKSYRSTGVFENLISDAIK